MCFNASISKDIDYIEKRFDAEFEEPDMFEPIYHVSAFSAPYFPVISNERVEKIRLFQWGLVPYWTKDERYADEIRFKTGNARAETIHEKPSFRQPIRNRRCLVLADGFYEWREVRGRKYPYYIRLKDRGAFAFAGIWDRWQDREAGRERNTFSIITTRANPLLKKIHNTKKRMPVMLPKENEKRWLMEGLERDDIDSMLIPYDDRYMEAYSVSKLITAKGAENNVPGVMKRFQYRELESEQARLFQ